MTRDGTRPPTTRSWRFELEWSAGTGPTDNRPPKPPPQPPPPNPRNPDQPRQPRPGRLIAVIAGLLLLLTARTAAGEPLGSRRDRPHHPKGWHIPRDEMAEPNWPCGRRPKPADNLSGGKP